MTTTITVAAHCTHDKEVVVIIDPDLGNPESKVEHTIIQDGDWRQFTIYDKQTLMVTEVSKE